MTGSTEADDFVVYCVGRGRGGHAPTEVYRHPWQARPRVWREGAAWTGTTRKGLSSTELRCPSCGRTSRVSWRNLIDLMAKLDAEGVSSAELGGAIP